MKSQIFIQLHIAFFAQILHNLNLKQQISILFPEHLRGDPRAQQKVFTPSDWIISAAIWRKSRRRGLLNKWFGPSRQAPDSQWEYRCRTCQTPEVSVSNTYFGPWQQHPSFPRRLQLHSKCWSVQSRLFGPSDQYFIEELPDKLVLGFIISLTGDQPSCVSATRDWKHLWHLGSLL